MKRERLARIKSIRSTLIELANELDDVWDEETKELEMVDAPTIHLTDEQILSVQPEKPEEQFPRIEDLKENDENLMLKARVAAIGKQMAGTTKYEDGTEKDWSMLTIHLNDDTSTVAMPLFNEEIDKADGLRIDDWVIVKAWKVERYKTQLQLKLGKFGTITKVSS